MEARHTVVDSNTTRSECFWGNRVLHVTGNCSGSSVLGDLLLEIAEKRIAESNRKKRLQ